MNEAAPQPTPRCPLRRFLVLSLRMLLVLIALLAVWLAWVTNRARLRAQVFAELKALKCQVEVDYQHPELFPPT